LDINTKFSSEGDARISVKMSEMAQADLRRVERAALKAAQARDELRQAILLARAAGETHTDIARAAGLSPQRIQQIVKESR
jgi:hypothetical protein